MKIHSQLPAKKNHRTFLIPKGMLTFFLLTCTHFSLQSQYKLEAGYIELNKVPENGNMIALSFKNLKIYPLFAGEQYVLENKEVGNYLTLKEGLASGKVEIKEMENLTPTPTPASSSTQLQNNNVNQVIVQQISGGASARVNELLIRNISKDTLFVMAGELVSGGKQDRVVGQNYLIPPGETFTALSVFCVEHGRWTAEDGNAFKTHNAFSANSVRAQAVVEKDQQEVWDKVAEVTSKNSSNSQTGTFNAVYENKEFMDDFNQYKEYFLSQIKQLNSCIGFVGVSGDKIIGTDIFATSEMFSKQIESLLSAYITDAITKGKAASLTDKEVEDYLFTFLGKDANQEEVVDQNGKSFYNKGKKIHLVRF